VARGPLTPLAPADESSGGTLNRGSVHWHVLPNSSTRSWCAPSAANCKVAEGLPETRQPPPHTSHHATVRRVRISVGSPAIMSFLRVSSVPTLNCLGSTCTRPGPLPSKSLPIHLTSYHSNLYVFGFSYFPIWSTTKGIFLG
jgi:hypothetical protein